MSAATVDKPANSWSGLYFGGPYDGAEIETTRWDKGVGPPFMPPEHRLPPLPRYDEAGGLIVLPLGTFERYAWDVRHGRYVWRGTVVPGEGRRGAAA